ncbi:MAG TPA: hypothetical protein VFW87_11020 [Pirellulales bacterium]|nr:hypothetical protein [Pirellulales bacterium]
MKRLGDTTDSTSQPLCGRLCQLGALAAAAAIAVAWWLAPVNADLNDVELLSTIALLGFCIVLAGMAADRLTTNIPRARTHTGYASSPRLLPAVASRSRRRLRHQP